jgi:hypothetical protein
LFSPYYLINTRTANVESTSNLTTNAKTPNLPHGFHQNFSQKANIISYLYPFLYSEMNTTETDSDHISVTNVRN